MSSSVALLLDLPNIQSSTKTRKILRSRDTGTLNEGKPRRRIGMWVRRGRAVSVGAAERDETTGAEMKRLWGEMTAKHHAQAGLITLPLLISNHS